MCNYTFPKGFCVLTLVFNYLWDKCILVDIENGKIHDLLDWKFISIFDLILWWFIWLSYWIIWELLKMVYFGFCYSRYDVELLTFDNYLKKVAIFVKSLNVERFKETTLEWATYFHYISLWAICVVLLVCHNICDYLVIIQLDVVVVVTFVSWHSVFVMVNKICLCDDLSCGLELYFLFRIINVVMAHNMYHIISWWVILRSFVLHCLKKNLLSKMKMVHFLVLTWLIPFMYDMVVLDM